MSRKLPNGGILSRSDTNAYCTNEQVQTQLKAVVQQWEQKTIDNDEMVKQLIQLPQPMGQELTG